jgi:excisionase family DNA binding protein
LKLAKAKTDAAAPGAPTLAEVVGELRAIRQALNTQGAGALDREAAAAYIAVSTATLERLTAAGKLKSIRVSEGRVAWRRTALDAYLAALEGQ